MLLILQILGNVRIYWAVSVAYYITTPIEFPWNMAQPVGLTQKRIEPNFLVMQNQMIYR
jgi:hypothetical protein